MKVKLSFVLVIWFAIITFNLTAKGSWFSLGKNGRLYGLTLSKIYQMTLVACLNVCQKKLECKTISFNKISKTCETFSDSLLDGDISDELGWHSHGNYLHDSRLVRFWIFISV